MYTSKVKTISQRTKFFLKIKKNPSENLVISKESRTFISAN
jgi:hypothetical protein